MFNLFKKPENKLPERIERYVSPRQRKVDCSINNETHQALKRYKEMKNDK